MASILIEEPGLLSTVQDAGRHGYQRFGMPVSGAMDVFALYVANALVGNNLGAACIEATLSGPAILFTDDCLVAVTGADMSPGINGYPVDRYRSYFVSAGDTLHFGRLIWGSRAYIAISGGLDVPLVMGSRSTCLQAQLGGFQGRSLKKGDIIALGKSTSKLREKTAPASFYSSEIYTGPTRIIPGPEIRHLSSKGIISLLSTKYVVSNQSNRMGYRLTGEAVELASSNANIISAGVTLGTVQLTGDGQPIILMADHQTTGGYARIAMVAAADIPRLAQMQAGTDVFFEEIDIETAQSLLRERNSSLRAWCKATGLQLL